MPDDPARLVVASVEAELRRYKTLAEGALSQLSDDELTEDAADGCLSAGTVVRHLAGNFTSRFTDFLTSDGEKPWRDRDGEFVFEQLSRAELDDAWDSGWRILLGTIAELDDSHLEQMVSIRAQPLTVNEALLRSLAHASYHVGQIVYIAKARRGGTWRSLSIPPGGSADYNQNPTREKPPA